MESIYLAEQKFLGCDMVISGIVISLFEPLNNLPCSFNWGHVAIYQHGLAFTALLHASLSLIRP